MCLYLTTSSVSATWASWTLVRTIKMFIGKCPFIRAIGCSWVSPPPLACRPGLESPFLFFNRHSTLSHRSSLTPALHRRNTTNECDQLATFVESCTILDFLLWGNGFPDGWYAVTSAPFHSSFL